MTTTTTDASASLASCAARNETPQDTEAELRRAFDRALSDALKGDSTASAAVLEVARKRLHDLDEDRRWQAEQGDSIALMHGLKSTAQSGLCSLHVFQHIFRERFQLLGLRERLAKLRTRNL
jgi:hypothetical protein